MSGIKCKNCGSTDIEVDNARGDAVCTNCGSVLEDNLIVSEIQFEEAGHGASAMVGQFVAADSTGGATNYGYGKFQVGSGNESREVTIKKAKREITHLCHQLQLNQHYIDTSLNFFRMALMRHLTRGRKSTHIYAACVYITCRIEGTSHLLVDISDVQQICSYELGRTYLKLSNALCINIPSVGLRKIKKKNSTFFTMEEGTSSAEQNYNEDEMIEELLECDDDTVTNVDAANDTMLSSTNNILLKEEEDLRCLVCEDFGLDECVFDRLLACGVDIKSIKLLTEKDLADIFPLSQIGKRARLRYQLIKWMQNSGRATSVDTLSANIGLSQTGSFSIDSPSSSTAASVTGYDNVQLSDLLEQTEKGKAIKKYYDENATLTNSHREILTSIVVDSYMDRNIQMRMEHITNSTNAIISKFPSECKDYYFKKRGRGLNPIGKLHDKAVNGRYKLRRLDKSFTDGNQDNLTEKPIEPDILSEEEENSIIWLCHNTDPWDTVEQKWASVVKIRRAEILSETSSIILKRWPLFKHSNGHLLVEIDYNLLFPENPSTLLTRWEAFVHKIVPYFNVSIKDKQSRYLLNKLDCASDADDNPCIYIMRFANRLQFGNKTHEVSNTALRIVQRMKKDSLHSGRRPTGLCGAALLIAARMHEYSRTIHDIVRIVKIHESTVRKRLVEFAETPSSALTLDEFMSVDLEAEQDPPAFKAARKKDRDRIKDIGDHELTQLQKEIDIQLEKDMKKITKGRFKNLAGDEVEEMDATKFISESNLEILSEYLADDPDVVEIHKPIVIEGLKPDIVSMCTPSASELQEKQPEEGNAEETGELDLEGLDDDEINKYILTHEEAKYKNDMWMKLNKEYLDEMKIKEEKLAKEREEGKPEKKKRPRKKHIGPSSTPGEAIKKMLQEKKISSKINYDILKTLTTISKTDEETVTEVIQEQVEDTKPAAASAPLTISHKSKPPAYTILQPQFKKPKLEIGLPVATETKPKVEAVLVENDDLDEEDDADAEAEPEPEPEKEYSSLKDMLNDGEEDDYYGYDEDNY